MKPNNVLSASLMMLLMMFAYSCQKSTSGSGITTLSEESDALIAAPPPPPPSPPTPVFTPCGTTTEVPLKVMPQGGGWSTSIDADLATIGTVKIANDETNLYVTYTITSADWSLQQVRTFVGDGFAVVDDNGINIPENPTFGHYDHYVFGGNTNITSYTYVLPLSSITTKCVNVMAFAQLSGQGTNKGSGKSWGVGTRFEGVRPAYYIPYCLQSCKPEVCYKDETGWAAGTRYVAKGNWATYTKYVSGATVNIYGGQTMLAGTATFSAITDGKVTITITLASGWSLQDVEEAVKIQGYTLAPTVTPSPGLFTTYKGTRLTVTVPYFAIYGIHLDLKHVVDCPPPTTM